MILETDNYFAPKSLNDYSFSYNSEAVVVFADATSLKMLRIFRKNFRHCFVAIRHEGRWVICDPLSNFMGLAVIENVSSEELIAWYTQQGSTAIRTVVRPPRGQPAPVRPFTCVEAVKRALGIHAGWVLTPWALYRYLLTHDNKQKSVDTKAK